MRSGPMRHRVEIQSSQRVSDGMGGGSVQWVAVCRPYCSLAAPRGRMAVVAQQLDAEVVIEAETRHRADIVAGMRLVYRGATYRIDAALPDNHRRRLSLLCSIVRSP